MGRFKTMPLRHDCAICFIGATRSGALFGLQQRRIDGDRAAGRRSGNPCQGRRGLAELVGREVGLGCLSRSNAGWSRPATVGGTTPSIMRQCKV